MAHLFCGLCAIAPETALRSQAMPPTFLKVGTTYIALPLNSGIFGEAGDIMPAPNESRAISHPRSALSLVSTSNGHKWSNRWAGLLILTIGLSMTGSWLVGQAIAPPAVHAYTGNVNVTIDVQPTETYDTLVRRAETIARAATQRSFDRDILVTDVSIVVIAQTATSTVPVLSLTTTRPQWRSQPDARRWATYYSTSKALLGMNKAPVGTTTPQPTVTNSTPTTVPSAQPRSTTPSAPKNPSAPATPSSSGGTTGDSQTPTTAAPAPILPQRIPTPGNIGK